MTTHYSVYLCICFLIIPNRKFCDSDIFQAPQIRLNVTKHVYFGWSLLEGVTTLRAPVLNLFV
jgi:hypothetical protein